jgi:flagellar hook-associated protein 3 FlgL
MKIDARTSFNYINQKALSSMQSSKSSITTLAKQITSGKYADTYTDLVEKTPVESLLNMKQIHTSLDLRNKSNKLLSGKVSEIENALRHLSEDIIKDSTTLCMHAKDPATGPSLDILSLSRNKLEQIRGVLNASFNGEKLFAGSKIKVTDVVGDIALFSNIVSGKITANYYNGDTDKFSAKISDTHTLQYGVTADNPAFTNLIAAHHYMINNDFDNAITALHTAKQDLGDLVAKIGEHSKAISQQVSNDDSNLLRLSESVTNIEDVDVTELMPQLAMLEVQLKASFMLTTQLSDLSLVNFLR